MIHLRLLQLGLAAGYATIVAALLARHLDIITLLAAIVMVGAGYAMARPLPGVFIDRAQATRHLLVGAAVMAFLIVGAAVSGPTLPIVAGSFCLGNRLRAGRIGAATQRKL